MKIMKTALISTVTICAAWAIYSNADFMEVQAFDYVPVENDCWSIIVDKFGEKYDFTLKDLLEVNDADIDDYVYLGVPITIPEKENNASPIIKPEKVENPDVYIAQSGDGWYSISDKTNVPVSTLLMLNNATLSTMIYVDQPIYISGGGCGGIDITTKPIVTTKPTTTTTTTTTESETKPVTTTTTTESETKSTTTSTSTVTSFLATTTDTTTKNSETTTYPKLELLGMRTIQYDCSDDTWAKVVDTLDLIDDMILEPDEIFSWYYCPVFNNQSLQKEDFLEVSANKTENTDITFKESLCFPATALYQCAVYDCNMRSIERHNHLKPVRYATIGEDAAVNTSSDPIYRCDMKFQNTTGYKVRFNFGYDKPSRTIVVFCYKMQ